MPENPKEEKQRLKDGLIFASSFILLLWIIKLTEIAFDLDFSRFGIYPRTFSGLPGILATPLIHKDLNHLFNNSVPLFLSIIGIFYFFRKKAVDIIVYSYLVTHFLIWVFAREAYHIGASGLVYTYISFLFFGGTFANNKNLLVISLIIIFIYGSMFWGMLPVKSDVSWESHLMGAIDGLAFAFVFRKSALQGKTYEIEEEEETGDDESDENAYWKYTNKTNDKMTED